MNSYKPQLSFTLVADRIERKRLSYSTWKEEQSTEKPGYLPDT